MKTLIGIISATIGLAVLALAGLGVRKTSLEFFRALDEWRNPRPTCELADTTIHSDGTVIHRVPYKNEMEIVKLEDEKR